MNENELDAQIRRLQDEIRHADVDIEALEYWLGPAQQIRKLLESVDAALHAPPASMTNPPAARAAYLRSVVVEPTTGLLATVTATEPADALLRAIHHDGVTALRLSAEAFTALADAFERSDPELLARARTLRNEEVRHRTAWLRGVTQLGRRLGINDPS